MDRWMNRGIDVWRCEGMKKWMDGWLSQWEGVVSVGGGGVVRVHGYVCGYRYSVFCACPEVRGRHLASCCLNGYISVSGLRG